MSSGTPTPILGLNTFEDTDSFLQSEVDANSMQIDTLPPTVCTSSTRPTTNLYQGRYIWETDTARLYMYDKSTSSWILIGDTNGAWVDFSASLVAYTTMGTTPTAVAKTGVSAMYKVIGKTCFAQASATFTAATASGAGLSLPLTAKSRILNIGTMLTTGATASTSQSGIAFMTDTSKVVGITVTTGYVDAPAGHNVRYNVMYELP